MTTNLFIPPLKAVLELAWTFTLHYESRNKALMKIALDVSHSWGDYFRDGLPVGDVTLSVGTCLIVGRIYIRNGARSFDSVTFKIKSCSEKKFEKARFWVRLADANKIVCEPVA